MAVAKAAKIVFQTALASTLESKGFRRVSDANYVLEGDGVEWRVVFGPEYSDDPGTFRDGTGIYLPEIDELYQRAFPEKGSLSSPLVMTKHRAHTVFGIIEGFNVAERNKGNASPKFDNIEPCFRRQETSYDRREHWATSGHDLEALGHRIDRYWRDYVWPYLEPILSKESVFVAPKFEVNPYEIYILLEAWVCGHRQFAIDELRRRKEQANQPDETVRKMLLARAKERYPKFHWLFQKPTESDVQHWQRYFGRNAARAERVANVLGVKL